MQGLACCKLVFSSTEQDKFLPSRDFKDEKKRLMVGCHQEPGTMMMRRTPWGSLHSLLQAHAWDGGGRGRRSHMTKQCPLPEAGICPRGVPRAGVLTWCTSPGESGTRSYAMATGTSVTSGMTPACTACTTSPSQAWPRADSRGPGAPGASSRKMSRGCPLNSSCSTAWGRGAGVKTQAETEPIPWPGPCTALGTLTAPATALARAPSGLSRERLASAGRKSPPRFLSRALWGRGQSGERLGYESRRGLSAYPTLPCPSLGLCPRQPKPRLLPESRGACTGVPRHAEHAQALGEQHEGQ